MSDIEIRKAQADDLQAMQEIARRTIDKSYRSFLADEAVDRFINSGASDRELERFVGNCDVLLKDNVIVAFSIYFEDLIHLMMVDVSLHRTGIGSMLLAHSEDRLLARGNSTIRLETSEGNQQAIGFYLKNGGSVVRKHKDKEHGFMRVFYEKEA
ncbi:MAG: GNAT family N-acetyltransferase [Pirellulales bacterium]|nr:GNAT family N-acetyltransferase [Pirellulales bacterium]